MKLATPAGIWTAASIVLLALLVGSEIFLLMESDDSHLSTADGSWRGASEIYHAARDEGYEVDPILTSPSLLIGEQDPENTLFVVIGPQRKYTLTEQHVIANFHSRGGNILIADDTGITAGVSSRFDVTMVKGQLYDENFQEDPDMVLMDEVDLPGFDGFLVMNKPSTLMFSEGRPLITSSPSSWVDRNENGVMDNISTTQGEAPGPRTLGVLMGSEGNEGNAVFLSDPSLFMNEMVDRQDNLEFFLKLLDQMLPDGGRVIFDESVHDQEGAVAAARGSLIGLVFLTTDVNMKIVIGTIVTITLLAVAYVYEPPERHFHTSVLDRTGVAEVVDPDISRKDITEMRRVFLDRVRVANGMSVDGFADLSWREIRELIGNDELHMFARTGKIPKGKDLTAVLLEVNEWKRT